MIKRYSDFINESPDYKGGIIQGELPPDEWLNILCESLNDELHVTILDNRLCDIDCRLVHEADAGFILNNKVYVCKELHIDGGRDTYDVTMLQKITPVSESYKPEIYKLDKKIQAEGYQTILKFSFGQARLTIFPKFTLGL